MPASRVAVVTGASSGIGEATARLLVREHGLAVVLVARREERLRELAASLGPDATTLAVDLTDDDAPARVRDAVQERHGRLDLLVNNAGAAWRATFADGGWENVRRHMEVNFDAVVRLTEALLPLLRASAPSAIVNVSSTAGRVSRPGSGAYSASKFAVAGWSDGGLPAVGADGQPLDAPARLHPGAGREGDRRGRARAQGRALRAAPVRARRCRAGAGAARRAPLHGRQGGGPHGHAHGRGRRLSAGVGST
jgi:hypothetical protein